MDRLPWFCQSRRCNFNAPFHQILHRQGPVPPGQEGKAGLILPAGRDCPIDREGVPRKRGPGTTPPVRGRWPVGPEGVGNAACERPLREGAHRRRPRRRFGYFAAAGKVTSSLPRPAGRNPINKKGRSDAERHSYLKFYYGRGSETKFRTKFFAQLSFKKAGARRPGSPP